ncbi:transmembrane protein 104-like isoform X2 [Oppia nitens]|nr:transmembrane protein 104-like isoform X2 [Oppia nitens]
MANSPVAGDTYSPLTCLVYLFNLIVGTGALTMPAAFGHAGWLASTVIVVLLCIVSYITTTFVIESMSLANALIKYNKQKDYKTTDDDDDDGEGDTQSASSDDNTSGGDRKGSKYQEKPSTSAAAMEESSSSSTGQSNLFDITEKVELGAMADLFFNSWGVQLFYITIVVYLLGDLAIYGAAISKSMRDVTCNYKHDNCSQKLTLDDQCWTGVPSVSRQNAYRIYLALTLLFVGPFAFFNVQKTKYLQIATTLLRWTAFISMTIIALIALSSGKANARPSTFTFSGIPNLFGVCVYSFMCHHSLPSLVTPVTDKRRIFRYILCDYTLILGFYCLLSFTGIFAFNHLQDIYTLNFEVPQCSSGSEEVIKPVPVLDYFLPLFPVFTLSSSFPIIAITMQNNLRTLYTGCFPQNRLNQSFIGRRLLFPLIAIVPPMIIAFATEDLQILVGIVGSYAGAGIQYVFPALLVYFGRRRLLGGGGDGDAAAGFGTGGMTRIVSPFGHKLWVVLVLIWSVICIILVTVDHVIQLSK